MKQYNVLVFPGGTEVGLEINRSLRSCKGINLFSAGTNISNHAPFVFKRHFILPSIHEAHWIEELNDIIKQYEIDFIYPAYDDVIVALAQNTHKIRARIVSSPLRTCLITRSKYLTYLHLSGVVPVPKIYEDLDTINQFPVFVKPDKGQGSGQCFLVADHEDLEIVLRKNRTSIVSEYLPGDEFTVDCFSDRQRGLLFCGARQRIRTKNGISMASKPINDARLLQQAQAINRHLDLYGAWFFQVKKDLYGNYKLLEIAPRIAGTMALHRVMGVNFALLSIYEQERVPVVIMPNNCHVEIERALTNRYHHNCVYDTVYIDLDDTLVFNGEVNPQIVRFIFQCLNKRISVKLITKHEKDLTETLNYYRLATLFDDIIHLKPGEEKASYIREPSAIFIDDSFSERTNVSAICGIPTFDSSMIELLFDDRA